MAADRSRTRVLAVRYVGALVAIAALLVAGQAIVQLAIDHQQGAARTIHEAGRQRMRSQRICMLLLALDAEPRARAAATLEELARVTDTWQTTQHDLAARAGSPAIAQAFASIDADHRAMLDAARTAIAAGPDASHAAAAAQARAHEEAFLAGMDAIVARYAQEAEARIDALRMTELTLLALVLAVLALEGVFVFRPAVRGLRAYMQQRDDALQNLLGVADREQQRIAQDLHDGLAQHLVGISYLVKALDQELAGQPAHARATEVGRLITESIDHTRRLARSLHSSTLDAEGLEPALHELAIYTERLFGVPCRVEVAELDEVPIEIRRHVYRIAREGVLNAAKHAQASTIEVEIARAPGGLSLTVRDDGIGMAPGHPHGMGLRLMESRARLLGAPLAIRARVPRGTTVSCTVEVPGVRP